MRILILGILPYSLFAQLFQMQQITSLTIEYKPICLLSLSSERELIYCDSPKIAGHSMFNNIQFNSQFEIFITHSNHQNKTVQVSLESYSPFNFKLEVMPSTLDLGIKVLQHSVGLKLMRNPFIELLQGVSTGYSLGDGIPIQIQLIENVNYNSLSADTYWANIKYELL